MILSIGRAVSDGAITLNAAGVADPRREAGSLLSHVIGRDRGYLITHADSLVLADQAETFHSLVKRRAAGEPLPYLTGHQEFYKLDFEVSRDVLIPRPETEALVDIALDLLKEIPVPFIADIGTGSGCIAISVLHELPLARALATDISSAALKVAERNAQRHGVVQRLVVVQSDCFASVDAQHQFSLILSNPPYVVDHEIETLQREVGYEPRPALRGGQDGLDVIRRLLCEAPRFLPAGANFVFEIGFGQREAVKELIDAQVWNLIEIRPDQQGIPRVVVLERK